MTRQARPQSGVGVDEGEAKGEVGKIGKAKGGPPVRDEAANADANADANIKYIASMATANEATAKAEHALMNLMNRQKGCHTFIDLPLLPR